MKESSTKSNNINKTTDKSRKLILLILLSIFAYCYFYFINKTNNYNNINPKITNRILLKLQLNNQKITN